MEELGTLGMVAVLACLNVSAGCGSDSAKDCAIEDDALGSWSGTAIAFPVAGSFPVEVELSDDNSVHVDARLTLSGYPLHYIYDCEDACGQEDPPYKIRATCDGSSAAAGTAAFCANLGDDGRLSMWIYDTISSCPEDGDEKGSGFLASLEQ